MRWTLRQAVAMGCALSAALITNSRSTAIGITLAEGQRHHAAIGRADNGREARNLQVIHADAARPSAWS